MRWHEKARCVLALHKERDVLTPIELQAIEHAAATESEPYFTVKEIIVRVLDRFPRPPIWRTAERTGKLHLFADAAAPLPVGSCAQYTRAHYGPARGAPAPGEDACTNCLQIAVRTVESAAGLDEPR